MIFARSLLTVLGAAALVQAADLDWDKINEETLKHYTALIQIDISGPPNAQTVRYSRSRETAIIGRVIYAWISFDLPELATQATPPFRPFR